MGPRAPPTPCWFPVDFGGIFLDPKIRFRFKRFGSQHQFMRFWFTKPVQAVLVQRFLAVPVRIAAIMRWARPMAMELGPEP